MTERRSRTWLWVVLGVLAFGALASCGGVLFVATKLGTQKEALPSQGVLRLSLDGELRDHVVEDPLYELFNDEAPQSFAGLLDALRKAKVDARVHAVVLDIQSFGGGWAKADELRAAISSVRQAHKPVYAMLGMPTNLEYYVALACDELLLAPGGTLFTHGLSAEVTFLRGALDKVGIYPDVFQIGRYKNAPDSFTRTGMSEAHREVVNALLDGQYERYAAAIADGRKLSVEEVHALIDRSPLVAQEALAAKLVDGLVYPDELEERLLKELQLHPTAKGRLPLIEWDEYRRVSPQSVGLETGPKVAIIYAAGTIDTGESDDSPMGEDATGSDTVVAALEKVAEQSDIHAVVLRVDSPGGSAFASDLIWAAVRKVKAAQKPVVVSMSDLAASGGYYIAANADRIVAEPSTLTGSIGVFAGKPVVKELYEKLGLTSEYVLRGRNAGLFRVTEPFTEGERARFEALVRHTYEHDFLAKVAEGRNKTLEEADQVAQGRVWSGTQGKDVGLVDELGGLDRAVEVARELAKLPASSDPRREILPRPRTLLEHLWAPGESVAAWMQWRAEKTQRALVPPEVRKMLGYARVLEGMRGGEVMALQPYELRIR